MRKTFRPERKQNSIRTERQQTALELKDSKAAKDSL